MARKTPAGSPDASSLESLWAHHHAELRDPHQIVSQWRQASDVAPALLDYQVRGGWWDLLEAAGLTLIVTREYEHLVMAFSVVQGRRRISFLHLPHPNGLAVDPRRKIVFIGSTRNPNMVYDFAPCAGLLHGAEQEHGDLGGLLLPVRARYLPGCLYLHDLAWIKGELYANAVGRNTVIRLPEGGGFEQVWWPRCLEGPGGPRWDRNYLQLNSIAPAASLAESYFTASAAAPSARRPGHLNFPVDRRGVVFSGQTREVVVTGLTRPHSARLYRGQVWVDNSGYGEVGPLVAGRFEPFARLPGWTRGLYFHRGIAFVGTSRVIPRYRHYAPGVACETSEAAVHVLDLKSGKVLGCMSWPNGNQIFAIEGVPSAWTGGFPFSEERQSTGKRRTVLFFKGLAA